MTADGLTVDGDVAVASDLPSITLTDNNNSSSRADIEYNFGYLSIDADANAVDAAEAIDLKIGGNTHFRLATGGDISFYEDTGTTAKLTWDASAESLKFADNGKAIFGAGSDLQIYSDGGSGIIQQVANGVLLLKGQDFYVQNDAGSNYIRAEGSAQVDLYYGGVKKFETTSTGVDVTGTVTADGLSLDGSYTQSKASGTFFTLTDTTNSKTGYINWESGNWNIFTNGPKKRWTIADNGDISFYEDTGTTAKFFWDASAESLGIGNTSPIAALDVTGTDAAGTLTSLGDTVTRAAAVIRGSTHANGYGLYVGYGNSTTDAQYIQSTRASGSTAFPLLLNPYGGNVGIGTSSPSSPLEVAGGSSYPTTKFSRDGGSAATQGYLTTGFSAIGYSGGTGADAYLVAEHGFGFAVNAGTNALVITDGGNVGIGTSSPSQALAVESSSAGVTRVSITNTGNAAAGSGVQFITKNGATQVSNATLRTDNAGNFSIFTGTTSEAERMRIDSSGNVGIGMTPTGALSIRPSGTGSEDTHFGFGSNLDAYITTGSSGNVIFREGDGTGGNTERMRIDSNGNTFFGISSKLDTPTNGGVYIAGDNSVGSDNSYAQVFVIHNSNTNHGIILKELHTSGQAVQFLNSSATIVGSISTDATSTTYNTSSDQRLKDNIVDAPSASNDIDAIQVRSFDWKADGSHQKYGMVAQELNTVAPEAVSAPEDPEDMMGVDYSKLVPMLVKEIQSLRARVAQLETN